MEATNYFLALIVAFSGLLVGVALAFFAKEEIKPGEKYLVLLQKILFVLAIVIFLNALGIGLFYRIALYALFLVSLFFISPKSEITYPLLAAMFFFTSKNDELFLMLSSIIFLYGFPTGSLAVNPNADKKGEALRIALRHISFPIIALALFAGQNIFY